MKLKTFTPESTPRTVTGRKPTITFNKTTGNISINKSGCELMGLSCGDFVAVHQDEDDVENWYLEKVAGTEAEAFKLRGKVAANGHYFLNTTLCKVVFESARYREDAGKALIAGQPTELGKRVLWGILTNSLRPTRKDKNDADN